MIEEYDQFFFDPSKRGPEKCLLACAIEQIHKHTTLHYHVEDVWALNMGNDGVTSITHGKQLQWVSVLRMGFNFNDEFLAVVCSGRRSGSNTF